ncbi:MAG: protein kinase [Lentisphaeria bacterium]|nr:protein kinase [Lentisphaeria bacterium]
MTGTEKSNKISRKRYRDYLRRALHFSRLLGKMPVEPDSAARAVSMQITRIDPFPDQFTELTSLETDCELLPPDSEGAILPGNHRASFIGKAFDRRLGRFVAVKSIRQDLKNEMTLLHSFLREVKITAQLDHPGIVPVYNIYKSQTGDYCMTMKLINGKTLQRYLVKLVSQYTFIPLKDLLQTEQRSLKSRLEIFLRLCNALDHAHKQDVIHGDICPENIMVGIGNEAYLMDWGKAGTPGEPSFPDHHLLLNNGYIAPELRQGNMPCTKQSDIYAMGSVLFEMVYLKSLQKNAEHTHLFHNPVEPVLQKIIRKALAENPKERYQTVAKLSSDLQSVLYDEEVKSFPDSIGQRFLRQYRHKQIHIIKIILPLLILCTIIGVQYFYREHKVIRETKQQDQILQQTLLRGLEAGILLHDRFHSYETALHAAVREAALRLERKRVPETSQPLYMAHTRIPPGFIYSPAYKQKISTQAMVCSCIEETPENLLELQKLAPMQHSFLHFLTTGLTSMHRITTQNTKELERIMFLEKQPPLVFVCLGTENGNFIGYPYHDRLPKKYDPRKTDWYQYATKQMTAADNNWIVQSHLPEYDNQQETILCCLSPIRNQNGKILGCATAKLSLKEMLRLLKNHGNHPDIVRRKMFLDIHGYPLAILHPDSTKESQEDYKQVTDLLLNRQNLIHEKFGLRYSPDGKTLWFFFYLKPLKGVYAEEIDILKLFHKYTDVKETIR